MGAIKAGDLVMIVRGHHCVVERYVGVPFTVRAIIAQQGGGWHCTRCKTYYIAKNELIGAQMVGQNNPFGGIPLSWLLKIDPPPIAETTEREQEAAGRRLRGGRRRLWTRNEPNFATTAIQQLSI